jgi:hypothetical protein
MASTQDTQFHGFPFICRVEAYEPGWGWWPQAQGSSYAWLREAMEEAAQEFSSVRLVTYYGEIIELPETI